jgi:BirA family biotin operon repressor/biotin-[acetyl-CoA-carboxylase] ligase
VSGDVLDPARLEQELRARGLSLGLPLSVLEQTGSTNDVAATEAMRGAAHGALVLAEQQTAGRGRLGRKWFSPRGQNLYMSLVLRPQAPPERLATITLAIGLAVAEAVAVFVPEAEVQVKWPNDVLIARRKAVGILVEASMCGAEVRHVIAGIGIDVLQTEFDPEIAEIATSIARHASQPVERSSVLLEVLAQLSRRMEQFERAGIEPMLPELHRRDACLGQRVRCVHGVGRGAGIQADGTLRVELDSGEAALVRAGDVELLG